jgi:hypothetical protein
MSHPSKQTIAFYEFALMRKAVSRLLLKLTGGWSHTPRRDVSTAGAVSIGSNRAARSEL